MTGPEEDLDAVPVLPATLEMANALGKVGAPPDKEATSDGFYFWVQKDRVAERTQVVTTECRLGDRPTVVKFVGLVEEVYRQSRRHDMGEEVDCFDGRVQEEPPFRSAGFTYAKALVLRTDPVTHAPPLEECTVHLGGPIEARMGYGTDRIPDASCLPVGLLRNGGTRFAGPAVLDVRYLLGENGGHLNVNGIAGLGAKSSFLLHINYLLMRWARRLRLAGVASRPQIVPIIFNVKNYDLFFIDQPNKNWTDAHRDDWKALGVDDPAPFRNVRFLAPQEKGSENPVDVGRNDARVVPYSWGLADIIARRLLRYLFAEEDVHEANFGTLVGVIEDRLTAEDRNGQPQLRAGEPDSFQALLDWLQHADPKDDLCDTHAGTKGKLLRRLRGLLHDGDGVLRRDKARGNPLDIPDGEVSGPLVIDLYGLNRAPALQRFVVAAVFHQLVEKRSGRTTEGLRYLVTLDELNRFAPRNTSSDPITAKIEQVASEGRSQGIILLGAQQQASLVSSRVIENAAIRALGRSGTLELAADVWKSLSPAARSQAAQLAQEDKLLVQPSFRAPMLAKIPFPPWALNKEEAAVPPPGAGRRERHGQDRA